MRNLNSKAEIRLLDLQKLEQEIVRLDREKSGLIKEQNEEIVKLSKLKEECMLLEKDINSKIVNAKKQVELIIKEAEEIKGQTNTLKSEVKEKERIALETASKANELIKSNEGKSISLNKELEEVKEIKEKLSNVIEIIKQVL